MLRSPCIHVGPEVGHQPLVGGECVRRFDEAHVPVISLSQDATAYFDWHHTANDTLDKIDPKDLDQNVAAWVAVTYSVAEMPGDLGRAPEAQGRGE